MVLPTPSHQPPGWKNEAPKADLRREITAWKALVWAYRDECVRVATNKHQGPQLRSASARMALVAEDWAMGEEPLGGFLEAHEDAVTIDAWLLKQACGGDRNAYAALALAAEANRPVQAVAVIPPHRVVPVLRSNGKPEVRYTTEGRRMQHYCLLDIVGPTEEERAAMARHQASLHQLFLAVLDAVAGLTLTKWIIVGRGA